MTDYHKLPSHKLVLVLKDCKTLLDSNTGYSVSSQNRLRNTVKLIRDILIQRQRV